MRKLLSFAIALALPVFLGSCFEKSTVIKVNKDGSGIVHVREYGATNAAEEDVDLPEESELLASAEHMGKAVRLQSVRKSRNSKGWYGTEVIYEFADINQVVLHTSDPKDDNEDKKDGKDDFRFRFRMQQGVLEVTAENDGWRDPVRPQGRGDSPTIDPYEGTSGPKASEIKLKPAGFDMDGENWKAMSKGMRFGIFLQIDDPLAETGSNYANGKLFTLMNADMEKITDSGEVSSFADLEGGSRAEMREIVEKVDGLDIELQAPVRFVFE